jgi:MoaA/NifB/PqqE/SkfB family radical SAM enzyme
MNSKLDIMSQRANMKDGNKIDLNIFIEKHLCPNPFMVASIYSDGTVSVCCSSRLKENFKTIGNIKNESLREVWNSKKVQKMRELIYAQNYSKTCYSFCPQLVHLNKNLLPPWYTKFCSEGLFSEIKENHIKLSTFPICIDICGTGVCNLSCIMCREQKKTIPKKEDEEILTKLLNEVMTNIMEIRQIELLGGGEPFLDKQIVIFLKSLGQLDLPHLTIRIITNGQLLTKKTCEILTDLKIKRLEINVSVDAAEEDTYEYIRRGGSWNKLMENLKNLSDLRKLEKINFLCFSYCVMKCNIKQMHAFVLLSKNFGVDRIEFQRIMGSTASGENFFEFGGKETSFQLASILKDPIFNESWIDTSPLFYRFSPKERLIFFVSHVLLKCKSLINYNSKTHGFVK